MAPNSGCYITLHILAIYCIVEYWAIIVGILEAQVYIYMVIQMHMYIHIYIHIHTPYSFCIMYVIASVVTCCMHICIIYTLTNIQNSICVHYSRVLYMCGMCVCMLYEVVHCVCKQFCKQQKLLSMRPISGSEEQKKACVESVFSPGGPALRAFFNS